MEKTEKKNEKFNFLSSIKEYLPLLYILLVCVSYIIMNSYYSVFNLDFINYLSFQEIIYIFLPISKFIILVIVFSLFNSFYNQLLNLVNKRKKIYKSKVSIFKKIPTVLKKIVSYTLLIASLYILFNFLGFFNKYFYYNHYIVFVVMTIVFVIFCLKLYEIYHNGNEKDIPLLLISGSLTFVFLFAFIQKTEGSLILNGSPAYNVEIVKENETFKSSDSLVYFGETKNYFFFRNLKSNKNIIIPNENVSKIIKTKIKY